MPNDSMPAPADRSDADLVRAALRDRAAFEALYRRYAPDVYRYVVLRLADRDQADDHTQRIFIRALENLKTWQPRGDIPFRAWLLVIARNQLIDDARRRRLIHVVDPELQTRPDASLGPEEIALQSDEGSRLRRALRQLPDTQREIVELRIADLTTPEIAAALNLTVSAVKSRQTRAYRRLRELLQEEA